MNERKLAVLLEDIKSKLSAVLEAMPDAVEIRRRFDDLDRAVAELEADVVPLKAVVTDHSKQLRSHERRRDALEANH